jgi:hypothetical protein
LGAGARNGLRRLVTTALRSPTTPVTGVASWAVGAIGARAAATVCVVSALLAVLAWTACAVGTALDSVIVADGCATVATTGPAPMVLVGVVALTVPACVEFDSLGA